MAGINTTGEAKTNDYNLGRGKLYFALLDTSGHPKGYRFLGNSPEFNITVDTETLEHQSSQAGLKVTDKEVTVSQKVTATISLDELNFDNLALFFSGTTSQHTNTATTGVVADAAGNIAVDGKSQWYDIYQSTTGLPTSDSSGDRMYDLGAVTVSGPSGTPVYVVDTDYKVDLKMGRIFIVGTGTIPASGNIEVDVAANISGDDAVDQAYALISSSVVGALKFIAENPADSDTQTEYQFHQISLKATGDMPLIGDEYSVLQLTGAAEKNITADPNSPTLTIRSHDNA